MLNNMKNEKKKNKQKKRCRIDKKISLFCEILFNQLVEKSC